MRQNDIYLFVQNDCLNCTTTTKRRQKVRKMIRVSFLDAKSNIKSMGGIAKESAREKGGVCVCFDFLLFTHRSSNGAAQIHRQVCG